MAPDHHTSERVYRALKEDLLRGVLGAGRLAIPALEERYHASATPIREGLLRLVGERLIDMRPTGGFAAWQVEEAEAGHLYAFAQRLIIQAVQWKHGADMAVDWEQRPTELDPAIDALFATIAERTGNSLMASTMDSLNDRLHALRRAEQRVLTGLNREFDALADSLQDGETRTVRRLIVAYHQRRVRQLVAILRAR